MLTRKQLAFRKTGIGGSDAAAVLGISPWTSTLELWLDKRNEIELPQQEGTHLDLGHHCEPFIAAELHRGRVTVHWTDASSALERKVMNRIADGKQPLWPGEDMVRHKDHDFMIGNCDRSIMAFDHSLTRPWGIVELKTAQARSFYLGWTNGVPLYYQAQVQHYMAVTGAKFAVVACLDLAHATVHAWFIERDDAFINGKLIPACTDFWELVQSGTPPQVDDSESCERALKLMYPEPDEGKVIELGDHDTAIARQYEDTKRKLGDLKKRERGFKNLILESLGDAQRGTLIDGATIERVKSGRGYTLKVKEKKEQAA